MWTVRGQAIFRKRGRPAREKSVCRACGLFDSQVPLVTVNGNPTGICKGCRAIQRRVHRSQMLKASVPANQLALFRHNLHVLQSLSSGSYELYYRHSQANAGNLTLGEDNE